METEFQALVGDFTIKIGRELHNYSKISDIPEKFDHLIKFIPIIHESPHSEEDHEHIHKFTDFIHMLQSREQK